MDGTSFNALYFPATMLHYVRTVATSASRRRWLYLGLATEVIPQDPKIREAIRSRLYQPAPMETSAAPVVHLRHLQQQSTTAYTWDLLQRLATRTQDKVTDYPSWHEMQRLQAAQRDYALACDRVAEGDWNQVEQQLLSLLSSLQGGSAYVRRASPDRGFVKSRAKDQFSPGAGPKTSDLYPASGILKWAKTAYN